MAMVVSEARAISEGQFMLDYRFTSLASLQRGVGWFRWCAEWQLVLINTHMEALFLCSIGMPKTARALVQLPPATSGAIEQLGADLAVARLRRKESLRSWSQRLGVSVSTLQRLEAGDPAVAIGIVASALWLIQRDGELRNLAAPEHDRGAIEMDVREAIALGRTRARSSAERRPRAGTAGRAGKLAARD
jgi:hypothetical protein